MSLARLADVARKHNMQVVYMHTRLTVKGVLKNFLNKTELFSLFHRAFFNSIMDKTPTHALLLNTILV